MKFLRLCTAVAALVFLMSTTPKAAESEYCPACANCYPGLPCYLCASYVMHAVGNCCGAIGGWASCVNNEWGFYASCNSTGRECQCNDQGAECDPDFRKGDKER